MVRMIFLVLLALLFSVPVGPAQDGFTFVRADPESAGMSSAKLRAAAETVRQWIAEEKVVGAVMLVLRNDKVVLEEAAGWSDREREIPMEAGAICRMRSMTKPLVGTSILMLVEEGRLKLEDRVSAYLPAFDREGSRDITLFQLLTHTSGITGDIYSNRTGTQYKSLREAVDDVGRRGPEHKPGTAYSYSDPGTSTLGAVLAEAAGMPAERFIETRILRPLGMTDSLCNFRPDDPLAARVASTYEAVEGRWQKYWDNTQPQLIPFFRASGGLYASARDYARFLRSMLETLRSGERRLLRPETLARALEPHSAYAYRAEQLREMHRFYGLHWQVVSDKYTPVKGPLSPGSFGHGGSDGTAAWADPKKNLIIIYLTQSRGNRTSQDFIRLVYDALLD